MNILILHSYFAFIPYVRSLRHVLSSDIKVHAIATP